jgi:hypothetical protein
MNIHVFLLLFFLIFFLALLCALCWPHHGPVRSRAAAKVRSTLPRLLKPRCPDDCPTCRLASTASSGGKPTPAPVQPWSEVKSRRGAPKRIPTEGFACPNRKCRYFGNTDAHFHALVGDGKHGQAEPIQTFRCQACRTTFTSRRNTALFRLKAPLVPGRHGALGSGRRAGPFCGLASFRLSTSHHHHLVDARGLACTHPA